MIHEVELLSIHVIETS